MAGSLALALAGPVLAQQENWSMGADIGYTPACVLVSPEVTIDDGQGDTPIRLEIDQQRLLARTGSNIDVEFGDLGVIVDDGEFIPPDRVVGDTDLEFRERAGEIVKSFIAGRRARLQFRFWPTWPTTGVKTAEFSLIGFTRAYRRLAECSEGGG